MERKKAIQGGITNVVITSNPNRQIFTNKGNRTKQINNYLRAPVGHLAPWQQVTKEGFCHQRQINHAAENPQ